MRDIDICYHCKHKSPAAGKLERDELKMLGGSCNQVVFRKRERILVQNSLSFNIVYIREGLVKVHMVGPEREQILKIAKGPCYLGIPATVGGKVTPYSVTCISETSVCFIGADIFKEFIHQNGAFAYEIILELCRDELFNFNKCINQAQKQGNGKIAEALLFFSENIFESDHYEIPLTRTELGDLTGTSRETVSRILSDFDLHQIIKIDKKHISILNKEQLERISETG
ncbi:MAG: Crp/Fnr family transcriptional regulator [Saprospiraceae bacterium]|nr:Crp/Fnr family transcriptional regulator [Saprospiraceae bacterium]MCB9325448.1 Crp/Fnr family transcriptional regulator [Lewinellaceae bacterium]